jgi:hypothetical protein
VLNVRLRLTHPAIIGLCLPMVLPALTGCPAHRVASGEIPKVHQYERTLRDHLDETRVGEQSLGEYLAVLEVQGCLEMEEQQLSAALNGLRRLHRQTYEHASKPARLIVWDIWQRRTAHFSPDGASLADTFLDHPPMGRSYFFCDDDLPTAWKSLDASDFEPRARAYFEAEVDVRRTDLEKEGADGARVVEELQDLRSRIERRFEAQFGAGEAEAAALDGLRTALDDIWYAKVDLHDVGRPALLVETPFQLTPRDAISAANPGEPATYSDHPNAAGRGAQRYTPGWVPPPTSGVSVSIPDPDDAARRARIVRSWKSTRRKIMADARAVVREVEALEEALATVAEDEREALLRELDRMAVRMDHVTADLGRHRNFVANFQSGYAGTDALVFRSKHKEYKRVRRGHRRMDKLQDEVEETLDRVEVAEVARAGGAGGGGGGVGSDAGGAAGGEGVAPIDEEGHAGTEGDEALDDPAGRTLVYEGPCPPPEEAWTPEVVADLVRAYPFIDEVDARIFLSLLQRAHSGLDSVDSVEAVVLEHLRKGLDLRLRAGRADELSDLYDPARSPADQDDITFYVWLGL